MKNTCDNLYFLLYYIERWKKELIIKKVSLKKFLLSSLIALQLSNGVIGSSLSTVYAKENDEERILFDENGKMLHMIGMIINDHEEITVGYVFVKDNAIYVEDVRNGKIYNFTNISEYLKYPEILYTEIQNVLPDELKNADFITQEEADELVNRFSITQDTVKLWGMDDLYDYTYETFTAPNFDNKNLHISNCSMFDDANVEVLIQFKLHEDGGFETAYFSMNDVSQSLLMMAGMIEAVMDNYNE